MRQSIARGNSLSCQQAPASFDKDLRTPDDVGIAGVFIPVMTDAYASGVGRMEVILTDPNA